MVSLMTCYITKLTGTPLFSKVHIMIEIRWAHVPKPFYILKLLGWKMGTQWTGWVQLKMVITLIIYFLEVYRQMISRGPICNFQYWLEVLFLECQGPKALRRMLIAIFDSPLFPLQKAYFVWPKQSVCKRRENLSSLHVCSDEIWTFSVTRITLEHSSPHCLTGTSEH